MNEVLVFNLCAETEQVLLGLSCHGMLVRLHATCTGQHSRMCTRQNMHACWLSCVMQELCDLLTGLLETDSTARLSIPEVQATSWFEGFDWQALADKTLPPPVLPAHALADMQQS